MARKMIYDQVPLCPSISLARALRTFQQDDTLCDLTLYSEDHKRVRVHKAVFAAMSGYLSKRLKDRQPCNSFILTGISVEGIRSLTEFVYGNVYAVHINNAEEIYPVAVLFEFRLLQKVCEYIDPEVTGLDWTNKIIPVSPNLLGRKPMGPKSAVASKKSEENNNSTPDSSEDQSSEEESTPQTVKGKRPAIKSPSLKEPQSKKVKRDEEKSEKKDETKETKRNEDDEAVEIVDKSKSSVHTEKDNLEKDPKLKNRIEIRLERVDPEKYGSPKRKTADSTSPEKVKRTASKTDDQEEKQMESRDEAVSEDDENSTEKDSKVETPKRKTKSRDVSETGNREKTDIVIEDDECSMEVESKAETPKRKSRAIDSSPAKKSGRKSKQPEETIFECGKCKATFSSLENCNEHIDKDHKITMVSVNKNFICSREGCGFKCDDAYSLKNHVLLEHPESLIVKNTCGICDAEFDSTEDLKSHCSAAHKKGKDKEKKAIKMNGKNNNDEPELDKNTGELKVTNRPGPKSAKLKQRTFSGTPKVAAMPILTETKIVNGQKLKVTYVDNRTVRVEDDSMLKGWAKLLVARRDLSKYDLYIQSADGRKHRCMRDLHEYLDKKKLEMETDHISFSTTQLMIDAGIKHPSGTNVTPRKRSKPGPKSSKKRKNESSDEEMEVHDDSDEDNDISRGLNGSIDDDDDEDKEKKTDEHKDDLEQDKDESDSNGSTHKVDVHIY